MAFVLREHVTAAPLHDRAEQAMVPMRDAVRLATDVYLPDTPTRHGAVLIRDPYDKSSRYTGFAEMAEVFNDRGLVLVGQDVRGKFRSEGETRPYHYDIADSYDTIEWIIRQPWSNGTVGLHGNSYLGYTTWAGVASGHPAIKGGVAQGTGVDMANMHVASLWRQDVPNGTGADDLVQIWIDNDDRYVTIDYGRAPVAAALEEAIRAIGKRSIALDDLFARSRAVEAHNPYGARHPYWTTNVPVLHWSNWFDIGLGPWGIRDFRYFRALPGRRDLHYLRAESADHGGVRLQDIPYAQRAHPRDNPAEHVVVEQRQAIDSADFLLPLLTGVGELPCPARRVRWHTGHSGWRDGPDWPPPGVQSSRWYLADAGSACEAPDGGTLAETPDVLRASASWQHDPADPVPSSVTPDDSWTFLSCYPDERDLGHREDVITFSTAPFERAVDICGQPLLRVAVETTGSSLHLFAKLLDVHPDGQARPIAHGRALLAGVSAEQLSQIDLDSQAYRVRAGHRLRLYLSSSDYPLYITHPGTDENPWFAERRVVNQQTLLTGGLNPSHLELPIMPADTGAA